MTTEISGTVEDENGNLLNGAIVYVVRASDDSIVGATTTNSSGEFNITGLSSTEEYHVGAQYDDGSTKYGGESYPFVSAASDAGPIDDFEDADLSEYSGDTLSFQTQDDIVYEKTYALEMSNDDSSSNAIYSLDGDGLPRYPVQGDTFSFRVYFEGTDNTAEVHFGVQASDTYYRARIIPDVDEISVGLRDGGSLSNLDTAFGSIPTLEWLEGVIEWKTNGDIVFTLNDASGSQIANLAVNDGTYVSGGIGWDGSADSFSGNSVYYDIAELTSSGGGGSSGANIDGFEDNDTSEYAGDTGAFNVQTSIVQGGSYALEADAPSASTQYQIGSGSGLNQYPQRGDTFEFYCRFPQSDDQASMWFFQQNGDSGTFNDGFRCLVAPRLGDMRLIEFENGSSKESASKSVSFPTDEWLRGEVRCGLGGRFTFSLYDSSGNELGSLSITSGYFIDGGIGWGAFSDSTGKVVWFDEATVISSESNGTTVDGFEDGDLSEYEVVNSDVSVQSDTVASGTYAVEVSTGTDDFGSGQTISTSGLGAYPYAGQGVTVDLRYENTAAGGGIGIAATDTDDFYKIGLRPNTSSDDRSNYLQRKENGNYNSIDSNLDDIPTAEWLSLTVQWQTDGTISVDVTDSGGGTVTSLSGIDTTFKGGGIGIIGEGMNDNGTFFVDNIQLL